MPSVYIKCLSRASLLCNKIKDSLFFPFLLYFLSYPNIFLFTAEHLTALLQWMCEEMDVCVYCWFLQKCFVYLFIFVVTFSTRKKVVPLPGLEITVNVYNSNLSKIQRWCYLYQWVHTCFSHWIFFSRKRIFKKK